MTADNILLTINFARLAALMENFTRVMEVVKKKV